MTQRLRRPGPHPGRQDHRRRQAFFLREGAEHGGHVPFTHTSIDRVPHDPDDFESRDILDSKADVASNRILSFEELLHERLIDDRDPWTAGPIASAEIPAR